ncbi:MAG: protein-L-isoaspartate O-methyltransferase [Candidatus Paceibacterota bacterium]
MNSYKDLINHLKNTRVLRNSEIKKAFEKIDRADFVRAECKMEAYEDYPLPIGYWQTISQPTTVAFMLELLNPQKGDKILDVGSGSGWTTALLSEIVGPEGKIFGIDIVPELVNFGRTNLAKYNFDNCQIINVKGEIGLKKHAPYKRILVSASFEEEIPKELLEQLDIGGIMIASVLNSIFRIKKLSNGKLEKKEYPGFSFVPFINQKSDKTRKQPH